MNGLPGLRMGRAPRGAARHARAHACVDRMRAPSSPARRPTLVVTDSRDKLLNPTCPMDSCTPALASPLRALLASALRTRGIGRASASAAQALYPPQGRIQSTNTTHLMAITLSNRPIPSQITRGGILFP